MKKILLPAIVCVGILFASSCDPCKDVDCKNGGTCDDGKCACAYGTEGNNCETAWRDALLGTYNCDKVCEGDNQGKELVIIKADDRPDQVQMKIGNAEFAPYKLTDRNKFSYTQTFMGETTKVEAVIENNKLDLKVTAISGAFSFICTHKGPKQ